MSVRIKAMPPRWIRVLIGLWVLLLAATAAADGRVSFLAERLKFPPPAGAPDDFRVRTNAALALGSTDADEAVAPLCGGLGDPSPIVRQASAVAMKRLSRAASLDCLRARESVETNAAAEREIKRAAEAIEAATVHPASPSGGGEAPYTANARFYVSVSRVTNKTPRATADVERIVRGAIAAKLSELGDYQLAPVGETNQAAKSALAKRKLKGYYLGVSVDRLDYSDSGLRVSVKIAVFSYPGRDLRGEVPAGASLPGARPGDSGAEDQLMSVVAARATELFAENFK
ncbi:MAG: HEAT repeat domain-containing protein [Polyangiaceae bacterium]